jgi:hypothetical protein
MDTDWMGRGKCRDMNPALFFPGDWIGVRRRKASAQTVP